MVNIENLANIFEIKTAIVFYITNLTFPYSEILFYLEIVRK